MTDPICFKGGCTCGYVRYQMSATPLFVHSCHCRWCQRETGSAFVINALIENDRLELLAGTVTVISTPTRSGKGQKIARCPKCQVALWSHYTAGNSKISFVRVGTLDNPDILSPDVHIYIASKQPWVMLPQDIPRFSGYYSVVKLWPQESLARRDTLRKKARSENYNPGEQD